MMFDTKAAVRTTLSIDDDVLGAAREMAERERKPIGEVISALARESLRRGVATETNTRNGIVLLPVRKDARPVTLEIVNQLRDELPG